MISIDQIFDYLKKRNPDFQKSNNKGQFRFTCPNEHKLKSSSPTCTTIAGSDKLRCVICGWVGNIYDAVRLVEKKPQLTDVEVISLLTNEIKLDIYPELEEYKKYGWSLLPIAKNGKVPLEKGWTEQTHRDKSEWIKWLEQGLNIGCRAGEVNGITVIDVDLKIAPTPELEEIYKELAIPKTLKQNSPKGVHFVFKYDKDLKQTTKIAGVTIDIRNDGGQFLVAPSKINNLSYSWVNLGSEIKSVPENVKAKLWSINKVDEGRKEKMSEEMTQIIEHPIELTGNNLTGQCNDTFIQFGGALLKMGIVIDKVKGILFYLNKHWLKNPMPPNVVDAMLGSLTGYKQTEEDTQEHAVYEACKLIQTDISAKDIIEHVFPGDNKKRAIVDKYLIKFHKEGKLSRSRRGRYDLKEKVEWTDEKLEQFAEYPHKIPYFDDIAHFHSGDIIVIGGKTGEGKTHIALNIIKQMKEQGVKPYYISLEAGSRYNKIAEQLGVSIKDFYVSKTQIDNPLSIEIEPNAFSIIDWLYTGEDFSATQSIFKHLNDEMVRKGGILIVFTQLKEDYNYFAVNLIKSFARFSCRFIYDDITGTIGHFQADKITDPRGHNKEGRIDTEFNFDTKELKRKNNL